MSVRVGSLVLVTCVTLTACAGTEAEQREATPSEATQLAANDPAQTAAPAEAIEPAEASDDPGVRRTLALDLRPESDVPTNLLPSVEVHDVGQDRTVNFRNIFPAERPVLLWMWAPF